MRKPQDPKVIPLALTSLIADLSVWGYCIQSEPEPWFHVTFRYSDTKAVRHQEDEVMFSVSLDRVFEMVKRDNLNITDIQLVCPPPGSNGKTHWQMLLILEIYKGFLKSDDDNINYVLIPEHHQQIVMTKSKDATALDQLQGRQLVYRREKGKPQNEPSTL